MAYTITRRMIEESSTNGDFGGEAWLGATSLLARDMFPEQGQKGWRPEAARVMDQLLSNTLYFPEGSQKHKTIPLELADDQIEDWLIGQAFRHVVICQDLNKRPGFGIVRGRFNG
jgi:hypothetical protein